MGKSIFVTYKYSDFHVEKFPEVKGITTVRDYVDVIQEYIEKKGEHIFKGENDGESLKSLADSTIASKLGDKIFGSSVTIVLISKGMKEVGNPDNDQWIPWEVSYSLREQSREGGNSKTNAMLAVVLPDEFGLYDYFLVGKPECNATTFLTNTLFDILGKNMFNLKNRHLFTRVCGGQLIYDCSHSYIYSVRWSQFITNPDSFINIAVGIQGNKENYDIVKTI